MYFSWWNRMKKRRLPRGKRKVHRKYMSGIYSNTLLFSSVLTELLQKYFNFLNLGGNSKKKTGNDPNETTRILLRGNRRFSFSSPRLQFFPKFAGPQENE